MVGDLLPLVTQFGGLGAIAAAVIYAFTRYLDHKPSWLKALLEQQEALTKRIDTLQHRIDALEAEKTVRERTLLRMRTKFYAMASRVAMLEGLLRANGIAVPEYINDADDADAWDDWDVESTKELTQTDLPI